MSVNTNFDPALTTIDHFHRYPAMLPYVGVNYEGSDHHRTLILGESNYLPQKSTVQHDQARWYEGTQLALLPEEITWLHCRNLLTGTWGKGQKIYSQINRCLEKTGVIYTDRAIATVAYMNAFQRPAATKGGSIKSDFVPNDATKSLEVIVGTVQAIRPEVIIIASRFTWFVFGASLKTNFPDVVIDYVCHPASHFHWTKRNYGHGREKFMSLLAEHFLRRSTSPELVAKQS